MKLTNRHTFRIEDDVIIVYEYYSCLYTATLLKGESAYKTGNMFTTMAEAMHEISMLVPVGIK